MQIGKAGELRHGLLHRAPALHMDDVQRGGETGAVLPARTFQHEGPGRGVECLNQPCQHFRLGQLARIQHGVQMGDAAFIRDAGLILPPGKIIIAAAQIDDRLDPARLQEWPQPPGPGLGCAGGVARQDPVKIVENIANGPHAGL